ncbi:MAG: copper resistance protein B [Gammaproteobacteria bacterium]
MTRSARATGCAIFCLLIVHGARGQHAEHAGHADHEAPVVPPAHAERSDHAGHSQHAGSAAAPGRSLPSPSTTPRTPLPPITDADRAAAFPADLQGHAAHEHDLRAFMLVEKFEWRDGPAGGAPVWDVSGWIGRDIDRLWFRADGAHSRDGVEEADVELLYGRLVHRWWDVVAGIRQDLEPGDARTWGAFGIQGLAPLWFEVQLTGYVTDGQFAAVLQSDYDLLLTNRLILQPRVDLVAYAEDESDRGIGSGLASAAFSLRLRYEWRREFAPYVGVEWERAFGDTGALARRAGGGVEESRVVAGLRMWF